MKLLSYSFEELDKDKWTILENEAQNLSVLQTYSWAETLKSTGTEPRFLMVLDGGSPLLGLLMFKSRFISEFLGGYETRKGPIIVPGVDERVFSFFASALKNLLRKESVLYTYWEPPLHPNLEEHLLNQNFSTIPSGTFIVDLSLPLETLWRNLEKRARWGVKKAQKMDVTVSEAKDWDSWKRYHKIYLYENYRKGVRPRSLKLHKSIYQHLLPRERAKLFTARHGGKTIAGSLFLVTPFEMIYYEGASNAQYLKFQPNNIIQWHAISWAKQKGVEYYDLGGALPYPDKRAPLYGVYLFKRQWGGKPRRFNSFATNRLYVIGRNLSLKNAALRRLYYSLEGMKVIQRFDRT